MKKEGKKFIKKIKKLSEGESLSYYDYEILCLNPKTSYMIIHNLDMWEISFSDLLDLINDWEF